MVEVIFRPGFKKNFKKIKNQDIREKIIKQVSKIKDNPDIGKPMMYGRKGTRELYISSFRLSYVVEGDITVLSLYHKDFQ